MTESPPPQIIKCTKAFFELKAENIDNDSWQYSEYLGNSNLKQLIEIMISILPDSSKEKLLNKS